MLNPKEKRKENKKYQFIHNTVVADREKKQNKARKLSAQAHMFVKGDGAMGEGARLLAQDSLRWHIDIFFAHQFFLGFSKEGFRVIVPDLVNSLSPLPTPRIGS